jgi:hypothetical protein
VRVFIVAALLCLGLSAPAQAGPITLEFKGIIDSVDGSVATHVAPGLSIGDLFTVAVDFYENPSLVSTNVAMSVGLISGSAYCLSCSTTLLDDLFAGTLYAQPSTFFGPPTPWSPSGSIYQTLFALNLGTGWQSGFMSVFLENIFIGGAVRGRITSMQVVPSTRVPEPGTVLTLSLGVCALAILRRRIRSKAAVS